MAPCRFVGAYQHFGGTYRFRLQGDNVVAYDRLYLKGRYWCQLFGPLFLSPHKLTLNITVYEPFQNRLQGA